jgi:hypothetical protein
MPHRGTLALFTLIAVILLSGLALGQEQTGSIQGTVKDASGAVLPGVTMEARSPALVGVATAVTDERGTYRFPALPPGTYTITAALTGFETAKVDGVALVLGQILKVDVTLKVAGVAETVTVSGEAPLIDVKQNAAGANIQAEIIDRIPKGRDFTTTITIAPGSWLIATCADVALMSWSSTMTSARTPCSRTRASSSSSSAQPTTWNPSASSK